MYIESCFNPVEEVKILRKGVFPEVWKTATVVSLFKKGEVTSVKLPTCFSPGHREHFSKLLYLNDFMTTDLSSSVNRDLDSEKTVQP